MNEANWGLSQDNLQLIVNILKKFLTGKSKFEVYIFGSGAKNKNRKYSDFDLWIDSAPELSANEISGLREDF
jgi:predicted nucleotidyltransferase